MPRITQKIKCNTGTRAYIFCVLVCVFLPLSHASGMDASVLRKESVLQHFPRREMQAVL